MKRAFLIFLCVILLGGMAMTAQAEETTLDFFKGLNFEDGLSVVVDVFHRFPLQYATTLGLDGNPQIRPIEFKFEEDGVLYFDTVTFYTSYRELLAHIYYRNPVIPFASLYAQMVMPKSPLLEYAFRNIL